MNDSPQQVQEEPQAQLRSGDHNCMDSSDDSVIPESVSDTGQSHLPDISCPIICGIHEMPLAIDVEETRNSCTDRDTQPTSMATPTPMLTPSTPRNYPLRDRQKHRRFM